jgi:hypothetical protein
MARAVDSGTERGAALLLALLCTSAMAAVAAGLLALAHAETELAARQASGTAARTAANAVLDHVVRHLRTVPDWTTIAGDGSTSVAFDGSSSVDAPWGQPIDVAALTTRLQAETMASWPAGPDVPRWRVFASGRLSTFVGGDLGHHDEYLIAWIADDGADADGNPSVDANGVLLVRAAALAPRATMAQVQVALARLEMLDPDVPNALPPGVHLLSWRDVR